MRPACTLLQVLQKGRTSASSGRRGHFYYLLPVTNSGAPLLRHRKITQHFFKKYPTTNLHEVQTCWIMRSSLRVPGLWSSALPNVGGIGDNTDKPQRGKHTCPGYALIFVLWTLNWSWRLYYSVTCTEMQLSEVRISN